MSDKVQKFRLMKGSFSRMEGDSRRRYVSGEVVEMTPDQWARLGFLQQANFVSMAEFAAMKNDTNRGETLTGTERVDALSTEALNELSGKDWKEMIPAIREISSPGDLLILAELETARKGMSRAGVMKALRSRAEQLEMPADQLDKFKIAE